MSTPNAESTAFRSALEVIRAVEPRVADAIAAELADQREIAQADRQRELRLPGRPCWPWATGSATSTPRAPSAAASTPAASNVDTVEALAAEHARELFGAAHAYVQPHSGIDANLVAFWAVLAAAGRGARRWRRPASARSTTSPRPDWAAAAPRAAATSGCSACRWTPAATSPTASGRTSPARCSTSAATAPTRRPACSTTTRCARPAREFQPLILVAGYSAYPRKVNFRDHARDRRRGRRDAAWSTWRTSPAWSPARSSPATSTRCRTPTSSPPPPTSRCAARAAAWCCASRELADQVDRGCPMVLGGPLPHVMAAKAVALAEARRPDVRRLRPADRRQRPGARRGAAAPRRDAGHRRHRQPPGADRRRPATASPAARPSRRCSTRASSPTATRSRRTRTAPGTPPASGSAPRR